MPEILYEDNHILVCIKPPGILSQSDVSGHPDMVSTLKSYIKISRNKPGNVYLGLLHRLDRSTGGLMVFALTSRGARRLSTAFQQHSVEKNYLALVCSPVSETERILGGQQGELTDHYRKDSAKRMALPCPANHPDAREARLLFSIVRQGQELSFESPPCDPRRFTLLDIQLLTGRFHQIRYQLASRGLPLVGESKYAHQGLPDYRMGLWSYRLRFIHPTGQEMEFRRLPDAGWFADRCT